MSEYSDQEGNTYTEQDLVTLAQEKGVSLEELKMTNSYTAIDSKAEEKKKPKDYGNWSVGNTFSKDNKNYILKEDGWHVDTGDGEGWALDQDDFKQNILKDEKPSKSVSLNNKINNLQNIVDNYTDITENELTVRIREDEGFGKKILSVLDDEQDNIVINARKNSLIQDLGIKVEGPDDAQELDKRGADDEVRFTMPGMESVKGFSFTLRKNKKGNLDTKGLNDWLKKMVSADVDVYKEDLKSVEKQDNLIEKNRKLQEQVSKDLRKKGVNVPTTEGNSDRINELKDIVANKDRNYNFTQVGEAKQELEKLTGEFRDSEFNQSFLQQGELNQKYNEGLKEWMDVRGANYLRENRPDIEEGSKEWNDYIDKQKELYNNQFDGSGIKGLEGVSSKRLVDIVNNYANKKETYDAAIAELKLSTTRGYGAGFIGDEMDVEFDWLPENEQWKLLDGLSESEIQQIAGGIIGTQTGYGKAEQKVAGEATAWNDERKQAHVNTIKQKLYKQLNRDSQFQYELITNDQKEIQDKSQELASTKVNLDKKVARFNESMEPIISSLNKMQGEKEKKEEELASLVAALEKSQDPATLSTYKQKYKEYEDFLSSKENLNIISQYEKLQKEGNTLTQESEKYNSGLETNNILKEKLKISLDKAQEFRVNALEKYSFTIENGMLKSNGTDYGNIKKYEEWRKQNRITHSFFDKDSYLTFGSGMINTAKKYASGTPLFLINGLNWMTGSAFSGGDERFSRLDALNAMYERYTDYDYFGTARDTDYEGGKLTGGWNKGTRAIAQGLPFMLSIMASGGKEAFKLNNWTKLGSLAMGKKVLDLDFANNIRMAKTAFHLTGMDNYIEGKKLGLSDTQAWFYGGSIGTITGLSQMIMPDIKFVQGANTFVSNITKQGFANTLKTYTTLNGLYYAASNQVQKIVGELGEESIEMVLGDVSKGAFNLSHAQESVEVDNWMSMIHDTVWLTGGTGLVGAGKDFNEVRDKVHSQLKGDVTEFNKTIDLMESELTKKLDKAKEDNDVEAIKAYEYELNNVTNAKQYVKNFKNAINVAPENVTNEQLADLTEKMRLLELKKNQDPSFHAAIDLQLDKINEKIQKSTIEQNRIETNKKVFENTVKTVKALAKQNNSEVGEFTDDPPGTKDGKTAKEKINDFINKKDENGNFLFKEGDRSAIGDGDFYGTYVTDKAGKKHLIINNDASQEGEGVNVAAHEFLHQLLENTFAKKDADGNPMRDANGDIVIDKKSALAIGKSLASWVSEVQGEDFANSELLKRLDSYGDAPTNVQAQEMLTLLSDSIVSGDMAFKENVFTKLGDVVRRGLQQYAGVEIKFNTGKDVYNFIKDYNKTIAEGKELSRAQKKVMQSGAIIGGEVAQLMKSEDVTKLAKIDSIEERRQVLAENQIDPDSNEGKALLKSKPSNVAGLLQKNNNDASAMVANTLSKTKDGKDVFEIKDNQGNYVDDAIARSEFGQEIAPITETITKRLFDPIPANLRNDISRGEFKNELTIAAATLVDKEFKADQLGEGQTIDDFISNRLNLRANKLASDLGIESTVEQGGLGAAVDIDQITGLEAEQTGPTNVSTPGMVLLNRIATSEQSNNIVKKVTSKIKGNQIEVEPGKFKNISDLNYKSLKNLVAPEVAEMFGIKSVENYLSPTKTLKNDDVVRARLFIGKNAESIYHALPLGTTASGTATGVKQVVLKNFYEKSSKRVKYDPKEGGAGIFPQVKKKISPADFAKIFGVEKGKLMSVEGQNPATLISGLMDEVGKSITNQTVRQQLDKMNTAQDKDVAARIKMLGDGKSDAMFSNAAIARTGDRSIMFYDKIGDIKGKNLTIANGNVIGALKLHFNKEISLGTFDVVNKSGKITQSTENLVEKVGAQIQKIYDRMTQNRVTPKTQEFNGQLISDIVVKQFLSDELNDTKSYKTIAGKDIQSITDPEVGKSARAAIQKLSQKFSPEFIEKHLVPSIAHASKYADGKHKFKPGTLEYEVVKAEKTKPTNRFGLANNVGDARALLGTQNVKVSKSKTYGEKVQPHKPPAKGNGIPSETNMKKIIQVQQEANQAFRDVVNELRTLYNNKDISKNDVVAILQSMNANPRALTRMAAILDFVPAGKDVDYKGEFRLEHMTPALQINLSALNYILNGTTQSKNDFKNDMDGYKVAYLPIKYDNLVNTLYKSTKPVYGQESIFRYYNLELPGFDLEMKQLSTGNNIDASFVNDLTQQELFKKNDAAAVTSTTQYFSKASEIAAAKKFNKLIDPKLDKFKILDKAILNSRVAFSKPAQGITVLDFDDTLATTKSLVKYTTPDGKTGTLNAEQYANTYQDLQDQGYTFDFSDFNKVVKGKLAPLFNKALKLQNKFGPSNMFVLTARPPQAAKAIFDFLKANGLNIPLKNITGLANSTSEAKALWIANKVGEGYNDFYFADDALQNVQAVKDMLDQFDVKSKVQQAKARFSKPSTLNKAFNDIIQATTGIDSEKRFSDAQAKIRGAKTKYKSIIPPSAQDFAGLLYNFIGKGKKGEADMAFFKKALIDPFARGINELNASRQSAANDYKNLLKEFKAVKKRLNKKIEGLSYTYDQAARVYLWNKAGFEVPGLSKRDLKALVDAVKNDSELKAFADAVGLISKKEAGYSEPGEYWLTENITSDLLSDGAIGDVRSKFLEEWQQNADIIFSKENLNKIEAEYGSRFREALQDILYRMKTGRNRPTGSSRLMNGYMNWLNNSVGAIMFFNMRSALLQTISMTNYINWSDNNPLKAAAAFANQPQYWKDFSYIFNSDFLKQRRAGNQRGINEAELSSAIAGSDNKVKAALNWLLKQGFKPTQIADSFAIASGGASFYRNRIKALVKQGMSKSEAEAQAFLDFQEATEVAQQSARPDMISQQQASPLGRLILSFQNTPMQYARIMNKAARDLFNGRGDSKTHISKIAYYGVVQSIIFGSLQSALFAALGEDEEEEYDKKKERILNGMLDSWLSGIGYGGKAISTVKNSVKEYAKQRDRGWNADHAYTLLQVLGFSPPIGSKLRKIYSSIQTEKFNKDVFSKRGLTLDNPIWSGIGNVVEGVTNVPLGRMSQKMLNLDNAMDSNNEWWQRVALVLGWNTWDLGIKDKDIEAAKVEIKKEKKVLKDIEKKRKKAEKQEEIKQENEKKIEENKKKQIQEKKENKKVLCAAISKSGKRCAKEAVKDGFCTVHEKAEQRTDGKKTQCKKIKKDGKRCGMQTSNKSGYCYYHD